ncbi:MAG: hypothetical protein ACTSPB_26265 [Candidatus Thorarchaeota archaeon]
MGLVYCDMGVPIGVRWDTSWFPHAKHINGWDNTWMITYDVDEELQISMRIQDEMFGHITSVLSFDTASNRKNITPEFIFWLRNQNEHVAMFLLQIITNLKYYDCAELLDQHWNDCDHMEYWEYKCPSCAIEGMVRIDAENINPKSPFIWGTGEDKKWWMECLKCGHKSHGDNFPVTKERKAPDGEYNCR